MKWLAALSILSWASFVCAQPMNFSEVVRRFVTRSPAIASAEAAVLAAQHRVNEGRSSFWPELTLSASAADQKSVFFISGNGLKSEQDIYTSKLELSQPIYLGGRVYHEYARRKEDVLRARNELVYVKNHNIFQVLKKAALWVSLKEQILVLRESQKIQKNFVEITRKKRARGAVLNFDLDQVEAEYLSYLPRIESLRQRLISTEQSLAVDLGMDPQGQFDFVWPVEIARPHHFKVSSWLQESLRRRPDYLMALSAVALAKRSQKVELGYELPSLYLSGEYGFLSPELRAHTDSSNEFHTFAMSLSIPLFSGFSSTHKRRATQQLVVQADRERRKLELQIEAEVRRALIEVRSTQKRLKQTQAWAAKAARALRLGLRSYQVGRVTIAQVVQLQSGRERAELALIEAQWALQTAAMSWQLSKGTTFQEYYTSAANR